MFFFLYFCNKINVLKHFINVFFSILVIVLLTSNCAKKGRPSGGKKDSIAPLMVTANPPYKTTNFKGQKVKIYFDEYIVLKDLSKQLVVSPPLKYPPIIEPLGTPSKYISIQFSDTLKANTTYTLNFGNSIQDNNEGNQLKAFKYVFSTGNYIDSLHVSGSVKDAFLNTPSKNTTILLYKIDEDYNDSIIYKQKPNYVTNTLDTTLFTITNIEKGTYALIALRDVSNNYLFNPKEDKIGFLSQTLTVPNDSVISEPISLFKEELPFRLMSPKEISKGQLLFGFEGSKELLKIEPISTLNSNFKSIAKFENKKDSLNYWFSNFNQDSIQFKVSAKKFLDTVTVFLRKKTIDSLKINSNASGTLHLKDTLTFISNNPITKIDTTKIVFIANDSVGIPYTTKLDTKTNKFQILFSKNPETSYRLHVLPKAFTDIFNTQNDTLNYSFKTKKIDDYGAIELGINSNVYPVIIELISEKNEVVEQYYVLEQTTLNFNTLNSGAYQIRAIIDTNKNKKWDTGNYLKKIKPEKIIYYPVIFTIKPNWLISETFILNN